MIGQLRYASNGMRLYAILPPRSQFQPSESPSQEPLRDTGQQKVTDLSLKEGRESLESKEGDTNAPGG